MEEIVAEESDGEETSNSPEHGGSQEKEDDLLATKVPKLSFTNRKPSKSSKIKKTKTTHNQNFTTPKTRAFQHIQTRQKKVASNS
jgi:hypothetical protein